jgi:serine/threonine protein kinase
LPNYDGWEPVGEKPIGGGGQGQVFKARSKDRAAKRAYARGKLPFDLRSLAGSTGENIETVSERLLLNIQEFNREDADEELGALKVFKIPDDDKDEEAQAVGRLESEIQALKSIKHPAVLKLLWDNAKARFIVTEFHRRGSLAGNLHMYKGDALAALLAFKPLVEGVVEIHKLGMIHRDIKPPNIFVATSGQLVLGDFGIVFFQGSGDRLTTTFERVGSHDWMAPWVYERKKVSLSAINPLLDIYPLAKVLWSMIAGKDGFPFWEFKRNENNLEMLFPYDSSMSAVNNFLGKCIGRDEEDCKIRFAPVMLDEIDKLIAEIQIAIGSERSGKSETWPCRVCGKG